MVVVYLSRIQSLLTLGTCCWVYDQGTSCSFRKVYGCTCTWLLKTLALRMEALEFKACLSTSKL